MGTTRSENDTSSPSTVDAAIEAARQLQREVGAMTFKPPVTHVYNPLDYAWECHSEYLRRFLHSKIKAVFLGMNPGPWGMVQTGVPFGEVPAVRDWMGIFALVQSPENEHPKRRIEGLACKRSEVSGRRLCARSNEILKLNEPHAGFIALEVTAKVEPPHSQNILEVPCHPPYAPITQSSSGCAALQNFVKMRGEIFYFSPK
jgi:hypothetical protein